jgi:hypothetical protein
MVRNAQTLVIASLVLLSACPSTNNNVGTVLLDGGGAGGASSTGGTTPASGGSGGGASGTVDAPQDVPGKVAQHPYVGSDASCANYPDVGHRVFPHDTSLQAWPTCTLNCNAVLAATGAGLFPLDQTLPAGPCDDEGATCDSPLMATWAPPCTDTAGAVSTYTCTCRAQKWQCAVVNQGGGMSKSAAKCLDPSQAALDSCTSITWSPTQVCACGTCRDLCSSDGDCQSGHCNLNQVCRISGSCPGPDECPAPCSGICAPAASDSGQASEVANSVSSPTDPASCAKATNVSECLPGLAMATVSTATGGPLLSNVEVTSGPCRPAACSSGCASLTIQAPTAAAGAFCDLRVVATDGRSQSVHISAIANPTPNYACCGWGPPPNSGGLWVILTPAVFSPNLIVVTFAADGGGVP